MQVMLVLLASGSPLGQMSLYACQYYPSKGSHSMQISLVPILDLGNAKALPTSKTSRRLILLLIISLHLAELPSAILLLQAVFPLSPSCALPIYWYSPISYTLLHRMNALTSLFPLPSLECTPLNLKLDPRTMLCLILAALSHCFIY